MNSLQNKNLLKPAVDNRIRKYIVQKASLFDFAALMKFLRKTGYSLDKIKFIPSESLGSPRTYINSIKFEDNYIIISVNDIYIADFISYLNLNYREDYALHKFFGNLFSHILFEYITSIYLEGREEVSRLYNNELALISLDETRLNSFAFIYHYLQQLFSEYRVHVYRKYEEVSVKDAVCKIGETPVNGMSLLGGQKTISKQFTVLRIITEYPLSIDKCQEIFNMIEENFVSFFYNIFTEFPLIIENEITDSDLYTVLPLNMTDSSMLICRIVRLLKKIYYSSTSIYEYTQGY